MPATRRAPPRLRNRDGLSATAYRVEPGDEATAPGLFGFAHRITVRFRFSAWHHDLAEHNAALMVGGVLGLAQTDGVLLFNREEAVVQTTAGEAIFAKGWEDWDDVRHLPQHRPAAPVHE